MSDGRIGHASADEGRGTRLDSWKEIAVFLGRDVTTAQRWERREGLPVHRLLHSKIGSVYAFTSELEAWREARSRQQPAEPERGRAEPIAPEPADPDAIPPPPAQPDPSAPVAWRVSHEAGGSPVDRLSVIRARQAGRVALVAALLVLTGVVTWIALRFAGPPKAAPGSAVTTVAVLPLRNLSGDPSQEFFADGMTEAIIARLAGVGGPRVISRTSAMQFKQEGLPVGEVAAALGADAVLEGSVHQDGHRVRVIARLIDGRTDAHLWVGEFDRDVQDVLALQAELAQAIADQIQSTVRRPTAAPPVVERRVSSAAYEHYLKGRFLLNESTLASVRQSLEEFQAAIGQDPTFAPAYAGLAAAHTDLGTVLIGATPGSESVDRAIAAANRAVALDPGLAEGYSVLGRALMGRLEWREAEAAFRRSLDLNPSDARTRIWFAEWLVSQRRFDEAADMARQGRDLDPLSMRVGAEVGLILSMVGRYEEAERQLRAVLAVQPDHVQALWWWGTVLLALDRPDEASVVLERAVALSHRSAGVLGALAHAQARAGHRDRAAAILDELTRRSAASYASPVPVAMAALAAGDRELALRALERSVADRANGLHLLRASVHMKNLRDDARFIALFDRIGVK